MPTFVLVMFVVARVRGRTTLCTVSLGCVLFFIIIVMVLSLMDIIIIRYAV